MILTAPGYAAQQRRQAYCPGIFDCVPESTCASHDISDYSIDKNGTAEQKSLKNQIILFKSPAFFHAGNHTLSMQFPYCLNPCLTLKSHY